MSKKCIRCGAELPDEASFCPHCTASQTEKKTIKRPKLWRKKALIGAICVALVTAGILAFIQYHQPKTYEGGAEVTYAGGDETYQVLLTFQSGDGVQREAQAETSATLPSGVGYAFPSQLYVYEESREDDVTEQFLDSVQSCDVQTSPEDGAQAMEASEPMHDENFPSAALTSNIGYTAECGTNDVIWTLNMKNGDTIILHQAIHAILQPTVSYDPDDTKLDTLEDLQALLDSIDETVDPNTVVDIYLPPVTYSGGITMKNRACNLYGGSDGEKMTTFTGTVEIETGQPEFSEIHNICFDGSGGTGLAAKDSVIVYDCVFQGWDTGAVAQSGAWVSAHGCTFSGNTVGLQFDSDHTNFSNPTYDNNTFEDNGTGVLITALPGTEVLSFPGCTFSGNGTDLDNPDGHKVDLTEATMK